MNAGVVIPALLPLFIAVAMRRAEASIYRQLADAGAITAESAIQLSPSRSLEKRRLQSLIRGGAVRLTADSRHFLDAEGWSSYQRNRRRRGLFVMSVVMIAVAMLFFVMRSRLS